MVRPVGFVCILKKLFATLLLTMAWHDEGGLPPTPQASVSVLHDKGGLPLRLHQLLDQYYRQLKNNCILFDVKMTFAFPCPCLDQVINSLLNFMHLLACIFWYEYEGRYFHLVNCLSSCCLSPRQPKTQGLWLNHRCHMISCA
jgi:hypothetical protein